MAALRRLPLAHSSSVEPIDLRRHFAAWTVIALAMLVLGWLAISSGRAADERDRLASQEAFRAFRSAASEASR